MISHEHRFIFIHVPKMAGTSIQLALGNENTATVRQNHHGRLEDYRRVYGADVVAAYRKFTVVRNPWDLEVSAYCYNAQLERTDAELAKIRTRNPYWYELIRFCKTHTFAEYVHSPFWFSDAPIEDFLTVDGVYAIDHFLRFERLQADFADLCLALDLTASALRHVNASSHGRYQEYYDRAARDAVAVRYGDYIRRFGYRFDPPGG